RPMRDIDLLVRPEAARQAQSLLGDLGYDAPVPAPEATLPAKHLAVARRQVEGMTVSVEIHHNLYTEGTAATALEALWPAAISFAVDDVTAHTLGYEAQLSHLYQHLRIASLHDHLRLIWIADLVGVAARFAAEIDWVAVNRNHSHLLPALTACHWLTPLPDPLLNSVQLPLGVRPKGVGLNFQGWPQTPVAAQRGKGWGRILADTFFPSAWWLSFYYGLTPGQTLWWGRWIRHPAHILGWVWHYLQTKKSIYTN
ncbi:MAG: nucleotidyltransferase family protein, partial [Anaerolineae bacterium]|nr:nucleotidyltransferase family protein [Anaerolineae bacterium]